MVTERISGTSRRARLPESSTTPSRRPQQLSKAKPVGARNCLTCYSAFCLRESIKVGPFSSQLAHAAGAESAPRLEKKTWTADTHVGGCRRHE